MSLFKAQVNFINEWVLSIRPFFSINQKSNMEIFEILV